MKRDAIVLAISKWAEALRWKVGHKLRKVTPLPETQKQIREMD